MAKHHAPDAHPVHDRAAVRTTVFAMLAVTLFVIAMIDPHGDSRSTGGGDRVGGAEDRPI